MARRGIVGRGILADVAAYASRQGMDYAADRRVPIGPDMLDAVLADQGTTPQPGDILILNTGWLNWYLALDQAGRAALQGTQRAGEGAIAVPRSRCRCGDRRVALGPSDQRRRRRQSGARSAHRQPRRRLSAPPDPRPARHADRRVLPASNELTQACASRRDWSFLFTSAPLNLPGGVGSPNNAYAVL